MSKTIEYLREVKSEMSHVTWPSRKQAMYFTLTVLIVSVAVAYYLGLFDNIFTKGLELLIR
jgi:preprotein translocase subunit SecE